MSDHLRDWLCRADEAKRLALIAHANPDGDTVGAALALRLAFLSMGKAVDVICDGDVPQEMRWLPGADASIRPENAGGYDTVIAVDVAEPRLLGKAKDVFDAAGTKLVIDHHATNPHYGDWNYIRGDECACCVLAYEVICAMGVRLDVDMGTCLMLGLSTDTGHFQYAYTTPKAFELGAQLLGLGVDVSHLTRVLYRSSSKRRVAITRIAYRKMRFELDGQAGVIELTQKDFDEAGVTAQEAGGLVNLALEVEGVRMAVLATERGEEVKLSLRAVEPDTVNDIARQFGGGGHAQAAGCSVKMAIDEATRQVLAVMAEKLRD